MRTHVRRPRWTHVPPSCMETSEIIRSSRRPFPGLRDKSHHADKIDKWSLLPLSEDGHQTRDRKKRRQIGKSRTSEYSEDQCGDFAGRNGDQQVVAVFARLCWSPHLLISEFTQDLLNRLYWSRTPNINCDRAKYASSQIWLKNLFWSANLILGGGCLFQQVMETMQLGDKYNHCI